MEQFPEKAEFYTVRELAQVLNLSEGRITQLLRAGSMQGVRGEGSRKWLIPKQELERYLRTPPSVELSARTSGAVQQGDLSINPARPDFILRVVQILRVRGPVLDEEQCIFWILGAEIRNRSHGFAIGLWKFDLRIQRDDAHCILPHIGRNPQGWDAFVPSLEDSLDESVAIGPQSIVTGKLRFLDRRPFAPGPVSLTLKYETVDDINYEHLIGDMDIHTNQEA